MASKERGRLRRRAEKTNTLTPRVRIVLARILLHEFGVVTDGVEGDGGDDDVVVVVRSDRLVDHLESELREERRRRNCARLYVEQLYRFEET